MGPRNARWGVPNRARGRHANAAIWAFGGAPCGATKRVRGLPKWVRGRHADAATGAFGGTPNGATKRVRGVPNRARCRHANAAYGAFCGAPYGDTKPVSGVPKWMRCRQAGDEHEELSAGRLTHHVDVVVHTPIKYLVEHMKSHVRINTLMQANIALEYVCTLYSTSSISPD